MNSGFDAAAAVILSIIVLAILGAWINWAWIFPAYGFLSICFAVLACESYIQLEKNNDS